MAQSFREVVSLEIKGEFFTREHSITSHFNHKFLVSSLDGVDFLFAM